jgi:uncharacterized membrane protein
MSESSTGLDPKLGAALCYLLGVISGVVFLVIEKKDRFVRFHAFQCTATFGLLFVLSMVVGLVPVIGRTGQMVLGPLTIVLWLMLMVKAFQGQRFKLPVVGDWAEKQA